MNRSPALALSAVLALSIGCGPSERSQAGAAADTSTTAGTASDSLAARADAARIQGSADAPVWVVEISDFQCPYCKMWHDSVYGALQREFVRQGTVRMAYINLPLPNHPNALPASEVAMCAGLQGKFWEVHDALFHTQERWSPLADATPVFDSLARAQGVDVSAMRACVSSGTVRSLIAADAERAREAGVSGTPAFLIGGDVLLQGMQPIEAFRRVIADKLGASSSSTR